MKILRSIWNYISPIWSGKDNKPSIKRLMALYAFLYFIHARNVSDHKLDLLLIFIGSMVGIAALSSYKHEQLSGKVEGGGE